jgi:hypothetical protein
MSAVRQTCYAIGALVRLNQLRIKRVLVTAGTSLPAVHIAVDATFVRDDANVRERHRDKYNARRAAGGCEFVVILRLP